MSGFLIPAEAGIQAGAGCPRIVVRGRLITSGMTALAYLDAGLITAGDKPRSQRFFIPKSQFPRTKVLQVEGR